MTDPEFLHAEKLARLLQQFSLEITGKDQELLLAAAAVIPRGTQINITDLGNESLTLRVGAARAVREAGFVPVPHIAARRLRSVRELEDLLCAFAEVDALGHIFAVSGDQRRLEGPYRDALAVIRSGLLPAHGVQNVGITGYPEGHPDIDDALLWRALEEKSAALREQNLKSTVITQFIFDTGPVLDWLRRAREIGIDASVRIGVPGPAGIRRLLRYASRFGVQSSAGILQKYGISLSHLLGTAGPGRFMDALTTTIRPDIHGEASIHFYTFGGILATAQWAHDRQGRTPSK